VVAALSLLLATGCGGDDSATGSSSDGEVTVETSSLSKAQFTKQANAVCSETRKQIEGELAAYLKKQNEDPTAASEGDPEIELVEETVIPNMQKQVDEISALGAPSGDEEELSAFLNSLQKTVDEMSDDPKTFIRSQGSFGDAPKLAEAYGLDGCASLT